MVYTKQDLKYRYRN